jgi:hypothetical protein
LAAEVGLGHQERFAWGALAPPLVVGPIAEPLDIEILLGTGIATTTERRSSSISLPEL